MTTMQTQTWWTRFLERLRGTTPKPTRFPSGELPEIGEDGLLMEAPEYPAPGEGDGQTEKPAGALSRWSKRDQTLAKLQEGYEKVTQVVEAVQNHLAEQGQRTERICVALEQLARSTSDLPDASRQQVETLRAIAGHMETTNARTHQLADTMSEFPKVARLQSETLSGIKRQLDMTNEQNLLTSQTMDKLGTAISSLGEFNSAQTHVLRDMNSSTVQQNELLTKMIAKQSRRFLMLFIVTVVLATAAVAAAIVAIAVRS
jgi:hypothetical protein